jgi:hypothetical protein
VKQGIRQGAKLSTVLYKRYNNNILNALDRSNMDAEIGNIRVVAPTCADDIALLVSTQSEAQALLDIVSDITSKDLVKIPCSSNLVHLVCCYYIFYTRPLRVLLPALFPVSLQHSLICHCSTLPLQHHK